MKNIIKRTYLLLLLTLLFAFGLCGCTDSDSRVIVDEKYIEAELQERYGIEFVCDSVKYSQHMYKAICHPQNDMSVSFECMYGESGSFGYDFYVGMLLAKEEEQFFTECIGNGLGESYIHCTALMMMALNGSELEDSTIQICGLIKNGEFTTKKAFEISPIDKVSFYIYVNSDTATNDYGGEYDVLEKAVSQLVEKYQEQYDLDIEVNMRIYYLNAGDYKSVISYYQSLNNDINIDRSSKIVIKLGIPNDHTTEDLWLTREEYIVKREEMNK